MTEQTNTPEVKAPEVKTQESKPVGRPAKGVTIENKARCPITLIVDSKTKETFLPTEQKEVSKDFMAAIRKNKAAMTYFTAGDLAEV